MALREFQLTNDSESMSPNPITAPSGKRMNINLRIKKLLSFRTENLIDYYYLSF